MFLLLKLLRQSTPIIMNSLLFSFVKNVMRSDAILVFRLKYRIINVLPACLKLLAHQPRRIRTGELFSLDLKKADFNRPQMRQELLSMSTMPQLFDALQFESRFSSRTWRYTVLFELQLLSMGFERSRSTI